MTLSLRNPGTDHTFCLPCSAGGQGDLSPRHSERVLPLLQCLALLIMTLHVPVASAGETIRLTTEKVIQLSLEKNLDLRIARLDYEIGETAIMASKAPHDIYLSLAGDHAIDKHDTSSTIFGTDNKTTNWSLGLSKKWITGTETAFSFTNQRLSTNSQFFTYPVSYEPAFSFSISQSVLKNTIGVNDRRRLKEARLAVESLDLKTQDRIYRIIHGNISRYWNLVLAEESLKLAKEAEEQARRLLNTTKSKLQIGLVESTDLLAAKSQLLIRENARLTAENTLKTELEKLRIVLQAPEDAEIINGGGFNSETHPAPSTDGSYQKAVAIRADYLALKKDLEAEKVSLKLASNERLPDLALTGSVAMNGLDAGYRGAFDDLSSLDYPTWYFGATFTFPIENRGARSAYHRSRSEKERAEIQVSLLEQDLKREVGERVRAVHLAEAELKNDRKIEELQKKKLGQETKKYNMGRSASDIVIRFQDDYINAKGRRLGTERTRAQAYLNLKLAEGTILEGVELSPSPSPLPQGERVRERGAQ